MSYIIKQRFRHNGQRYLPGEAVPKLAADEKARLLNLGVIERAAAEHVEAPVEKKPSKAELLARCNELGIDTAGLKTVADLEGAIADHQQALADSEKATAGDQGDGIGLPEGVDPDLQ